MNNGILFRLFNKNSEGCYNLKPENCRSFDYPGFYFIYFEDINGEMKIIYCGQSTVSVGNRLIDHYKKFTEPNYNNGRPHDWRNWYLNNSNYIKGLYFTPFESFYGPAFENFIIYREISEITFNLNTVLNGHNTLLNINDINYIIQPRIGYFLLNLFGHCAEKVKEAAINTKTALYDLNN